MSGGTARLFVLIGIGGAAVQHAAVFGRAVCGVFTRDMMLVVSVDLAAMLSLINVT